MSSESTPESIAALAADWCGRGSHVEFETNETVPLREERFLGYGVNGGVWETACQGIKLAWKRRYCRGLIGPQERKEIEVLKKLSHHHIIQLVGTYSHRQFLGLLLWPVAVCDLGVFFEDFELFTFKYLEGSESEKLGSHFQGMLDRFDQLSIGTTRYGNRSISLLLQCFGCLAQAVAYLHNERIRHKDLKPSNILLYHDGLRLTDFGTSTDFSALTVSVTDNGERGTPKYFAPEVAAFQPNGRAADIFSLGDKWCGLIAGVEPLAVHLLAEIKLMLAIEPEKRPAAEQLVEHLTVITCFKPSRRPSTRGTAVLFGPCCTKAITTLSSAAVAVDGLKKELESVTKALELARRDAKLARDDANALRTQNAELVNKLAQTRTYADNLGSAFTEG
ncbi:serine/threonine protein kinase [Coniosporium apollinis CBS 100218]|uniref:Serine/threonine protein kinase n=1 Tax=Coniosporium apollinis (strain CBS 100218) TaxID=1168221 RepID=R7YXC5_CONA1|nr:serine/threonine protein kinase [Coniosporium apollinis CBS 100218]EON66454.1 serine/threonine protein kinase [Coniosporium apollinis CBS 100218]